MENTKKGRWNGHSRHVSTAAKYFGKFASSLDVLSPLLLPPGQVEEHEKEDRDDHLEAAGDEAPRA